jgi:hypothetical protein
MGKVWAIVVVGVVMAFLLGVQVGAWMTEPESSQVEQEEVRGASAVGEAKENRTDEPEDIAEMKRQNEKLAEQVAQLQARLVVQGMAAGSGSDDGPPRRDKYVPMEWPENTPPAYGPGEFERLFRKIAEESEAEVDIVGMHCDEPPCLMVRRVPPVENSEGWGELIKEIRNTPTWGEHFPKAIGHQGTNMPCGDGRTETVQIIWFTPDEWDEHFVDDMLARRWIRVSDIAEKWECLPAE